MKLSHIAFQGFQPGTIRRPWIRHTAPEAIIHGMIQYGNGQRLGLDAKTPMTPPTGPPTELYI